MEENKDIKYVRTFYQFLQVMIIFICKILYRFSWEDVEHIPETGGVIIASNHASYIDPPAIGAVLPREAAFFAKKRTLLNSFDRPAYILFQFYPR